MLCVRNAKRAVRSRCAAADAADACSTAYGFRATASVTVCRATRFPVVSPCPQNSMHHNCPVCCGGSLGCCCVVGTVVGVWGFSSCVTDKVGAPHPGPPHRFGDFDAMVRQWSTIRRMERPPVHAGHGVTVRTRPPVHSWFASYKLCHARASRSLPSRVPVPLHQGALRPSLLCCGHLSPLVMTMPPRTPTPRVPV